MVKPEWRVSLLLLFSAGFWLTGCGHSPSFNVLGSYFPGWIACMVVGALLAVLFRLLLRRLNVEHVLPWLPVFYFCLATIFACTFWLFAFD